jgi:hypothetical protein
VYSATFVALLRHLVSSSVARYMLVTLVLIHVRLPL